MSTSKEPANPFYLLLAVVGVLFVITACGYAVMVFRAGRMGVAAEPPHRVPGTAIFMTAQAEGVPYTLLYNLRHNQVLHERVILMTVTMTEVPRVPNDERIHIELLSEGFFRITASYGFIDEPDVHEILERCAEKGVVIPVEAATFFVGRETLFATERPGMPLWRDRLFALMSRNTPRITTTFNIPVDQVIEIGAQIEL